MAFKEKLDELIKARGGKTPENFYHIVDLAREVAPDFTERYLTRLLLGHPPRPIDYQALGAAFGVSPSELIDDPKFFESENKSRARNFASDRMGRPDLAGRLIECVETGRYRYEMITEQELYFWFKSILESLYEEDE